MKKDILIIAFVYIASTVVIIFNYSREIASLKEENEELRKLSKSTPSISPSSRKFTKEAMMHAILLSRVRGQSYLKRMID